MYSYSISPEDLQDVNSLVERGMHILLAVCLLVKLTTWLLTQANLNHYLGIQAVNLLNAPGSDL